MSLEADGELPTHLHPQHNFVHRTIVLAGMARLVTFWMQCRGWAIVFGSQAQQARLASS